MFRIRTVFYPSLYKSTVRNISSIHKPYDEVAIPVPWGYVCGRWWGPTDIRPVLSLHGWQDNCGTFNRLIPLLNKTVGFLAIDFPGHGYSSRLPPGMFYYGSNYIMLIKYLKDYFKWPKVSLMGHSLGGICSYVYTMLCPDNVDFTICLDGAKPLIRPQRISHMPYNIDNFLKYSSYADGSEEPPSYTIDEIKSKICSPNNNSIKYEYCHHVMERNIAPSKIHLGKFYFTRDPRLKSTGLLNMSQNELVECAQNITGPIFISKAKEGSYYEVKENFYEVLDVLKRSSSDCDFHYVEGTHHMHLNNPEELVPLLNCFIRKHNIEDRSIGGISEIIIKKTEIFNS